jgi:hypothetical protein
LALHELEGQHTGENQAQLILKIIKQYGIVSKVGYFMTDNAENNETTMRALPTSKDILQFSINNLIKYVSLHNLTLLTMHPIIVFVIMAISLIWQPRPSYSHLMKIHCPYSTIQPPFVPSQLEMNTWRRKGPLGKLHNIVVYIQRSPQRRAAFQKLSQGRHLIRDNKTRWNSWYAMIGCAIDEKVRPAIELYCYQNQADIGKDISSIHD